MAAGDEFEPEDLIEAGSERRAVLAARMRRHPLTRVAVVLALVALAVVAVTTAVGGSHRQPQAAPPSSSGSSSTPSRPVGTSPADNDVLYTVPAEDLRGVLAEKQCRSGCVANSLYGVALVRAGRAFRGLDPLAGGTVTRADGRVIFQSIEARATPDALVHLLLRRDGGTPSHPTVRDGVVDGSRTVTVRQARDGWQLSASIVVRGSAPPSAAALAWCARTVLPD